MSDKITKTQYWQLQELKKVADNLQEQLDTIVQEALAITEEGDEGGLTFDFILNDFGTLDELLDRLQITVSDE